MFRRLAELKVIDRDGELLPDATRPEHLYALYMRAGGKDTRSLESLRAEGATKIEVLRERGYDLGYGYGPNFEPPVEVEKRLSTIYDHARQALYKKINEVLIKDVSPKYLCVRSDSCDRNEYLSHPPSGERICREDTAGLINLYKSRRKPQLQFVISDGLNADAQNENLRAVLPRLRREISDAGCHIGDVDIIVNNGRVRAGYHIGQLLDVDVIVHLIGERPGTGLNTLSAYITYGKDATGQSRWGINLDHSHTNAVCGIHPKGKPPVEAVTQITRLVKQITDEKCSGVSLGTISG
jgi:ethanolamine ammonia-lyase small subunit